MFLLLALEGCFHQSGPTVSVTYLNQSPRPMYRRYPASVRVYTMTVPDNATEVYSLSTYGEYDAYRLDALRNQAAELGCDGIVIQDKVEGTTVRKKSFGIPTGESYSTNGYTTAVCVMLGGRHGPGPR